MKEFEMWNLKTFREKAEKGLRMRTEDIGTGAEGKES